MDKQVNRFAVGSSVGPTLANVFLVYFEKNWLQNCPSSLHFKPHYCRCVDDIFVLFTLPEHLEAFRNFRNDHQTNMLFITENEKQNRMSLLDAHIIRQDKTFTTSVCHKSSFSGIYKYFDCNLPSTFNFDTVYTLALDASKYAQVGLITY